MRIAPAVLLSLGAFGCAFPTRDLPLPAGDALGSAIVVRMTLRGQDFINSIPRHAPVVYFAQRGRDGELMRDNLVIANMRAGAYRLRFVRDGFTTLDRDITVRAGEPLVVDVALSAAVAPKAAEPPPATAPVAGANKPLGPAGEPKLIPIPTFIEKNFIGREGQKDSPLGCTSTGTATLIQLREALLNQTHEDADEWIYVVAGEGALRLGTADQHLQAGTFALIPHTAAHGLLPSGRNPLIFISFLSGYKTC